MTLLFLARHRSRIRTGLIAAHQRRNRHGAPPAASQAAGSGVVDGGGNPPSTPPLARDLATPPRPPTSAYVHLPFCVKKCYYCDFPVRALGREGASSLLPGGGGGGGEGRLPAGVESYLETLLSEIDATSSPASRLPPPPLRTVSFGGGTPSLLPPEEIARIVEALARRLGPLDAGAEVSLEADPGTFDEGSLRGYVDLAGVTRLSLGVQSFDEGILRGCGRSHGIEEVEEALRLVAAERERGRDAGTAGADGRRRRGLRSWSLDLVAGLPGLDRRTWRETCERAVLAGPDHISVYDLQLEAGTPFGDAAARLSEPRGAASSTQATATFSLPGPLPAEGDAAQMLRDASSILSAAGYRRYEVSNYSKREPRGGEGGSDGDGSGGEGSGGEGSDGGASSHESRHNKVYWRGDEDYHAFGLGASSRLSGVRVTRPRSMRAYSRFVEELRRRGDGVPREDDCFLSPSTRGRGESDDGSAGSPSPAPPPPAPPPSPRDVLLEVAMLRLRTADGLDLGEVAGRWGEREAGAIRSALSPIVAAGLACYSSPRPTSPWPVVRLTDPEGFLVSNSVISDVFVALDGVPEL